ncbi:unnamed protein product [Pleuronectes platessa]|uniref:Uncharacterized protein n=1 Tax=Pleuronectes platessa TaxID=8262 RepID=A0A9N7W2P6_PLEPL|nr:unnamed protein product [Pleuronectes platessa]
MSRILGYPVRIKHFAEHEYYTRGGCTRSKDLYPADERIVQLPTVFLADVSATPEPPGHLHAHLRDGGVQHGGVPVEARHLHTAARPPGHERESMELLIRTLPFQHIQLARRIRGHRA